MAADLSTPEGRREMARQLVAIARGCSEADAIETIAMALSGAYSTGRVHGAESIAGVIDRSAP